MPGAKSGPITQLESRGFTGNINGGAGNIPDSNLIGHNFQFSDLQEIENLHLYKKEIEIDEHPGSFGSTSMFNQYNVFTLSRIASVSGPNSYDVDRLYDSPRVFRTHSSGIQDTIKYNQDVANNQELFRAPTASKIISLSNDGTRFGFGKTPYAWSDFLYCKYYGLIPNNNLITLRRYPYPVYDNLHTVGENKGSTAVPVAQAVTWLGEETGNKMSTLLKFSFGVVWKEIESKVQDIEGNEVGFGAGMESLLGPNFVENAGMLKQFLAPDDTRWAGLGKKEQNLRRKAWTDEGPYWNQVYGPVNVVHKTHMRERGVKFDNVIKLKFQYSLKSINGVNPKVAMLDLITNFLSLTYTNAKWWGGSARYFPNYDDPILFFGAKEAFYKGDIDAYFKDMYETLGKNLGSIGSELAKLTTGSISEILTNAKDMLSSAGGSALSMIMGKLARKSRPEFLSIRSLLSGEPIGEWHLTIGNPLNPMAVIGNLIIDDTEMEFNDILGADDFPTEVTFTVTLKHARPRDKGDIESIFNYGQGQLAYSPLTTLPSEKNTLGNKYEQDNNNAKDALVVGSAGSTGINAGFNQIDDSGNTVSMLENQKEYENIGNSSDNRERIKQRINTEWGSVYANSDMLAAMFSNKQYKM